MEQITSLQLGDDIFNSCLRFARYVKEQKNTLELFRDAEKVKVNVNFEEILVGFMWAIFDLLNTDSRYERTTRFLFTSYVSFLDLDKKEADAKMRFLEKRFYEYKDLFRKEDGKTDYNYLTVAMLMSENITKEVNLLLASTIAINIQEFVLMWDKLLDKIEVIAR